MTGEALRPERERTPEGQIFNVAAMSDDEIVMLFRGLYDFEPATEEARTTINGLVRKLASETCELVSEDPERIKGLVRRCALSEEERDRQWAARIAPSLVHHDYEFMREALLHVMIDHERHDLAVDDASDEARYQVAILMRDHLSPEQAAEFNTRRAFYDNTMPPISPAGTDSYWQN